MEEVAFFPVSMLAPSSGSMFVSPAAGRLYQTYTDDVLGEYRRKLRALRQSIRQLDKKIRRLKKRGRRAKRESKSQRRKRQRYAKRCN